MVTSGRIAAIARRYAFAAVVAAAATGALVAPQPAHAIDTGAAVGIGLGSFALGSMLGAASNPYYGNPYGYGYGYGYAAPPPAYAYPPAAPAYYPPTRSCWDPYYRRHFAC